MTQLTVNRQKHTAAQMNTFSSALRQMMHSNLPRNVRGNLNRVQIDEVTNEAITESIESIDSLMYAWCHRVNTSGQSTVVCYTRTTTTTIKLRIYSKPLYDVEVINPGELTEHKKYSNRSGGILLLEISMLKTDQSISFIKYWTE